MQATCSTETEKIEGEPSQTETTLKRSDKGKEVAELTPLSSLRRPPAKHTLRWLQKEVMRSVRPRFRASEEYIYEIAEILNTPESPAREAIPLAFIIGTRNSIKLVA